MLAEEDEIVAAALELGGERRRDREAIGGHGVGLELHRALGAHAHRLAERLLHEVGAEQMTTVSPGPCFSLSWSAASSA